MENRYEVLAQYRVGVIWYWKVIEVHGKMNVIHWEMFHQAIHKKKI
jgi:hypothetical protein